jgi:hypothetical protein
MSDELEVFLFPDTNVFLHYEMFDAVDWSALVGGRSVVLCISRTVTKELEEKKYDQKLSSRKRDRVKKVSAKLDQYLEAGGAVRSGVRLLIVRHPEASSGGLNLQHADDALVAAAYEYKLRNGCDARIASADVNLRNTARGLELALLTLPTTLELPPEPDDAEVELKRLRSENERLKSVPRPRLSLGFAGGSAVARLKRPANELVELPPILVPEGASTDLEEATFIVMGMPKELRTRQAKYRRAKAEFDRDMVLTFKLELTLFNKGEAPARGVHLELTFPDHTLVREELPEAPKEPTWPNALFEMENSYARLAMIHDPTDWDIGDAVVSTWRREVVHSLNCELPPLYVRPHVGEKGVDNFQIQCRIVTSDPPTKDEFPLHIVYEDGQ